MKRKIILLWIVILIGNNCFPQITVTFNIDVGGFNIYQGGMHITGQFVSTHAVSITEEWQPHAAGSLMTLEADSVYSVDVIFPKTSAGDSLQFEFVRDSEWISIDGDASEGNPGDPTNLLNNSCGIPDGNGPGGFNRLISIPLCGGTYTCKWNKCGTLIPLPGPHLTISSDTTLCTGESVKLFAMGDSVKWLPDSSLSCSVCPDPVAAPKSSTSYIATAQIGGCILHDTVTVDVIAPYVNASNDTSLCDGTSIQLSASGNGTISWSPATGLSCTLCSQPVASPATTTLYVATSTISGCNAKDSSLITVNTSPALNVGNDQTIMQGQNAQLNATGADTYTWKPSGSLSCSNCASPLASPQETTTYVVIGTLTNGCYTADSVTVEVIINCDRIFIPDAFSPNGDGINDFFGAISENNNGIDVLRVFNRWGQLLFSTSDINQKWNGAFQGTPQPIGTYVYYLQYTCEGKPVLLEGSVMLIR